MAIRQVRIEGDPIVRKVSREVTVFDEKLKILSEDMIETMYATDGIGIAGPQVGVLKRIVIIADPELEEPEPIVVVNPKILERTGEQRMPEGCLSVPGRAGYVKRPTMVKFQYQDIEGNHLEMVCEGNFARVIDHENDHLDGILYIDKMDEEIFLDEMNEDLMV